MSSQGQVEISDDELSQFLAFTGTSDTNVARQYLEMSGCNLEMAVGLFLEHGGSGSSDGRGPGNSSGTMTGTGGTGGGLATTSGSPEVRAPDRTRTMRLMDFDSPGVGRMGGISGLPSASFMSAIGGPGNMLDAMNGNEDDAIMGSTWAGLDSLTSVRSTSGTSSRRSARSARSSGEDADRAIDLVSPREAVNREAARRNRAARRERGSGDDHDNDNHAIRSDTRGRRASYDIDTDDEDDVQIVDQDGHEMDEDEYDYDDESNDDDDDMPLSLDRDGQSRGTTTNQPPSLVSMFASPTHLMHRAGGFLGAKNFAKDARRWLLVNLQSEDDFACHALNRDVWRDELVENLVREGFIFWQAMSHTSDGQTYVTRYKVHGYPHLAIIDPRTGSLLWKKEGWTQVDPLTAEQFVEIASDFCSRHSFDKPPVAARHGYSNGTERPNKRPVRELTEEEQLQAAIRASMMPENNGSEKGGVANCGDVNAIGNNESAEMINIDADDEALAMDEDDSKPSASLEPSLGHQLLSVPVGEEPAQGLGVARVQIRMPDGKRMVRRFRGQDAVKVIYAFVAQSNEEAKGGKPFELKAKFPPQDLLPSIDETISDCGLSGEAINVMWK